MAVAYCVSFILSILVIVYLAQSNLENVNIQQWTMVVLIPVVIGAYFLTTQIHEPESAYAIFCFIYIDSTIFLTVLQFLILHYLKVNVSPWAKIGAYGVAFAHILTVVFAINTPYYYEDIQVIEASGGSIIKVLGGPLMKYHYIYIGIIMLATIAILIVGYLKKGTYSFRMLAFNTLLILMGIVFYAIEVLSKARYSLLPFLYLFYQVVIAGFYNYNHSHEIPIILANETTDNSAKGYMVLSLDRRFLGCNEKCIEFVPTLSTQRIDEKLPRDSELKGGIDHFIDAFIKGERNTAKFNVGDRIWICDISYFSIRKNGRNQGYLFELRDATEEEKMYDVLNTYNETLNAEVKKKTEHIVEIQRKVVLGMANLIENRDSNTGGHVKRTSEVVKILIDEINKQGKFEIDDELAMDIIRSAPMHDLGKISIDSTILCKPGRLADDEFDLMKTHAAKSGEIVHILLDGVEENHFVDVAYNVARHHHERWDGTGYPDGLKGEDIPIGARIMAVADVYDALVSKRCYKAPMHRDKAAEIMLDGMGNMFDPAMKDIFLGCKDKLEAYYAE